MSTFDDRVQLLRETAERASEGLGQLSEPERAGETEAVLRLEHVLSYSSLVLESTEGELVSEAVFQAITAQLSQIEGDPVAAIANAVAWSDGLLDAVSRLPVSKGQDFAQGARKAAANYRRSVQQQLHAIAGDAETARTSVAEVEAAAQASTVKVKSGLDAVAAGFTAKLAEYEQALTTERSLIEATKTSHAETFREAQAQRDEDAKADITKLLADAANEVAERVSEIQRMEAESADLVGAIGLAGTAEGYGQEAREQRKAADSWRWGTVVFVSLAVAAIVVIVVTLGSDPKWETVVVKLSASVLFGGIAAYAASQSGRHRDREERARATELELAAFGPFIEPLIQEQREEERVRIARKTFGKVSAASPTTEDELGPLSLLLQHKEKESSD